MAADYLYQTHTKFDRNTVETVATLTRTMQPSYPAIYLSYLFATHLDVCCKVPVPLLHGRQNYKSVADLEVRPWIDLNSHRGVTQMSDHHLRYRVGDLIYHIFVDLQDSRKSRSPHFSNWQGNVLVVHEAIAQVVDATEGDMDLVKTAVRECLRNRRNQKR
ncbi:hypothetical protein BT96DRAFT_1002269 [Gymnopus androsaceus JB14]|uniref:Uncharacterized protein n=1 Tax=Gymnopus androsaceus JB14 TaxID=1447944 RepID=A0A6A4GX54_9AGAR|nr:hypothetical protein BT96DRAFT_1002269 [Gymnopus androsaceus JB14]